MQANLVTRRQRGVALLGLMTVIVLVMAYLVVSRFNAASAFVGVDREHNGKVLNQAKQALIGWVARQAATANENNPGRLPCPEAGAFFGTVNEGTAAGNCTLPAIGRLPWRTLGMDKPLDAGGEALWYVVSPGWALSNSTTPPLTTYINSNSVGQLTVDGAANNAVALIIAPGRSFNGTTACSAVAQVRAVAGAPNRANYLECANAAGATFETTGASDAFNDQVIRVTAAELLPEIEAAIAERTAREIVPLLQNVYASNAWAASLSATNPAYPYPAPFADPAITSSFRGSAASCAGVACEGLLPVNFSNNAGTVDPCTPSLGSLCDPTFVAWSGGTVTQTGGGLTLIPSPTTCTVASGVAWSTSTTTRLDCVLTAKSFLSFGSTIEFQVAATASNVGMAMRQFNAGAVSLANATMSGTPTVTLNSNGSATVRVNGTVTMGGGLLGNLVSDLLCGLTLLELITFDCRQITVQLPLASMVNGAIFSDHALLNASDPTTGWFMRNEWYRVMYYSAAQTSTPSNLPAAPACAPTATVTCLTVNTPTPETNKRSILFLAGRSRNGTVGATRAFTDFLDSAENQSLNGTFEKLPVGSLSNDRVVVVDINP
jgi:hypothetical protein